MNRVTFGMFSRVEAVRSPNFSYGPNKPKECIYILKDQLGGFPCNMLSLKIIRLAGLSPPAVRNWTFEAHSFSHWRIHSIKTRRPTSKEVIEHIFHCHAIREIQKLWEFTWRVTYLRSVFKCLSCFSIGYELLITLMSCMWVGCLWWLHITEIWWEDTERLYMIIYLFIYPLRKFIHAYSLCFFHSFLEWVLLRIIKEWYRGFDAFDCCMSWADLK